MPYLEMLIKIRNFVATTTLTKKSSYQIFLFFLASEQRHVHIAKITMEGESDCEKPLLGHEESFQIKSLVSTISYNHSFSDLSHTFFFNLLYIIM